MKHQPAIWHRTFTLFAADPTLRSADIESHGAFMTMFLDHNILKTTGLFPPHEHTPKSTRKNTPHPNAKDRMVDVPAGLVFLFAGYKMFKQIGSGHFRYVWRRHSRVLSFFP